jgi:ATP synthase subunit 6
MNSPLEQFEIIPLIKASSFYFVFSNSTLFCLISLSLVIGLLCLITENLKVIPARWQSVIEIVYLFVKGILLDILREHNQRYFPVLFFLFNFILIANFVGLVPYSFTLTGQIYITFSLACLFFIGITLTGLLWHKLSFLGLFFPEGAPLILAPLFVVLELVSYFTRLISLSVRLFANLMAGHTLLKILAGFSWLLLTKLNLVFIAPLLIIIAVSALELAIAIVQAYVFVLLVSLYLKDSLELH